MKRKKIKQLLRKVCEESTIDGNSIINLILKERVSQIDKQVYKNKDYKELEKQEDENYKLLVYKYGEKKTLEELLWIVESKSVTSNEIYYKNGFMDALNIVMLSFS